ncbi:MAG: cysteine desulfurase family protein [Pirellulaceae bacterium]
MIYLDHHATTPLDPRALEAMLPLLGEHYANPGSIAHAAGRRVAEMTGDATARLAALLGAEADELVITSGATESNNLALFGVCLHPRQKRRRVVSVVSEHRAILDPLKRLAQVGFDVTLAPVHSNDSPLAGQVDMEQLAEAITPETALVSVMLANNEIGVIQPLRQIAELCRANGCLLHTDATQAVGRLPVNVDTVDVDLLSFSAHKFYGPKGVGGLYVRRRGRRIKLLAQIVGGGQQQNFRSGTLNSAGIVGMAAALTSTLEGLVDDTVRIQRQRDRLFQLLQQGLDFVLLNGPPLHGQDNPRLSGNLNCSFFPLEGQSLMLATPDLAVSSGSACTTAEPMASHVLRSLGLSEEISRSSLRFGVGRYNTDREIEQAAQWLIAAATDLGKFLAN